MIYIAICDDNEKTVEILKKKVMEFLKKSNEFADITVYTQSENLQYDIQEGKYYDLILSDIEMPNIDGMNCKLRSNGMPVPLLRNGYSIFNGTKYR